ncbi:hypothetical protein [Massilia sp. DD77]|uniref:hypothetical protein n=1 Tax=Massilia sp. DD77 TaxID=3109349 RepID=UPI002FFEA66A
MAMQSGDKDSKGRSYDQLTRDGTSSAGTMGTGGTGDIGRMSGNAQTEQGGQGGNQQAGRTDDLLAGGSEAECADRGFRRDSKEGQLDVGMGGMAKAKPGSASGAGDGNRQSGELNQQGSGGQRSTETDRDQDTSARER